MLAEKGYNSSPYVDGRRNSKRSVVVVQEPAEGGVGGVGQRRWWRQAARRTRANSAAPCRRPSRGLNEYEICNGGGSEVGVVVL